MARIGDRHPDGAPGDWFVDTHCFDCDAARNVAPGLIIRNQADGVSLFAHQPETPEEIEMAWRAVQVCPTRSVGHVSLKRPESPVFPEDLGDGVFRLGNNSKDSFGAHSYLVQRATGNLMIDGPRWTRDVYGPLDEMGGIAHVLLSHRDDVADAQRYAERYGARVWIHEDDASAAPFATDIIRGEDNTDVSADVVAIPVPGHTKGSVLYLVDGHLLFSGDSLSWHPEHENLMGFRRACWYSWDAQMESLGRFGESELRFDRLFCGHGWNHDLDADAFNASLLAAVARG